MKKIYIVLILCFVIAELYAFPLKILSHNEELKVYNNLDRIDYIFEGMEDYAYIDRLGIGSDTWAVYFHSMTGNARELYRSHIYHDLWISKIRGAGMGSVSVNICGDSFLAPKVARSCHYMIHYIKEKYGVKKFVFMGASMGGFCALRYGELYPQDVSCIIAIAPNGDLKSMFAPKKDFIFAEAAEKSRKKFFPKEENVQKWNLYDDAEKLNMPVFLAISREDEMVPVSQCDRFAHLMKHNCKFKYVRYDYGTHFQIFSKGFADGFEWYQYGGKELEIIKGVL